VRLYKTIQYTYVEDIASNDFDENFDRFECATLMAIRSQAPVL
jgi:hypothetical protein